MSTYVQVVFPVSSWDTGTVDGDGNAVWGWLDFNSMCSYCNSKLLDGNVLQLWGMIYSVAGNSQPQMIQLLTNDLSGLKSLISIWITSVGAPSNVVPVYVFSVDVTVNP